MRILLIVNPRAGRGRGEVFARSLESALRAAGHETRTLLVGSAANQVESEISWSEGVVVAGGDGTLHRALPNLLACPRPAYHAALGTENLFAREVGHRADPEAVVRTIGSGSVRRIDIGELEVFGARTPFAIMASVGPDASVIRRLDASRRGPISHSSYVGPILRELFRPYLPRLDVIVDGREVVRGRQGMVVVANLRQYACRVDPVPNADAHDGQLDVIHLPARTSLGMMHALAACRVRRAVTMGGAIAARGRAIEIRAEPLRAVQADGESIRIPESNARVTAQVGRFALNVFVL